jgi:hypothetical protein
MRSVILRADASTTIGGVRVGRQKEANGSMVFRRSLYIVILLKT